MKTSVLISNGPEETSSIKIVGSRNLVFKDGKTHKYEATFINDTTALFESIGSDIKSGSVALFTFDRDILESDYLVSGLNLLRAFSSGLKFHATAVTVDGKLEDPLGSTPRLVFNPEMQYFVVGNAQHVLTTDAATEAVLDRVHTYMSDKEASVLLTFGRTSSTGELIHLQILILNQAHREYIDSMNNYSKFLTGLDNVATTDPLYMFKLAFMDTLRLRHYAAYMHVNISDRQEDTARAYAQFRSAKQFARIERPGKPKRGPLYNLPDSTDPDIQEFVQLYSPLAASSGENSVVHTEDYSIQIASLQREIMALRQAKSSEVIKEVIVKETIEPSDGAKMFDKCRMNASKHLDELRALISVSTKELSRLDAEIREKQGTHSFLKVEIEKLNAMVSTLQGKIDTLRIAESTAKQSLPVLSTYADGLVKLSNDLAAITKQLEK